MAAASEHPDGGVLGGCGTDGADGVPAGWVLDTDFLFTSSGAYVSGPRVDVLWGCYLPMARGFCYLVAVMDWASRRVLAWRLSNTLDPSFCTETLEEALNNFGAPEIFNTDQGSQFTSGAFTGILRA